MTFSKLLNVSGTHYCEVLISSKKVPLQYLILSSPLLTPYVFVYTYTYTLACTFIK